MSIRTASGLPSTLTCKPQAQYIVHDPSPYPTHPPTISWMVPRSSGMLLDRRRVNAKKPRVGGAEFGRNYRKVSTTLRYQTSVRLAPPLRQRCDGDHKNALFCQVLQKVCACMTARPRTDALPSCPRGRVREARVK